MTTTDVVGTLLAESGMAGDAALTAVLTDLRDLAAGPPPEPSPELAALLAGDGPASTGVLPAPVVPLTRRRRAALGMSAVVLAAVASTGVAAAANQLPSGAQRFAARFSDQFLPFAFPLPREAGPLTPGPLGPHGGGNPQHPDGPAAQGTAPPATLDPATATPSDHPADRHGGEHDALRTRGTDDGDEGVTGDDRDGRETHHRDRDGSRSGDDDRSDGSERSGRTESGYDGSGSDDGERSGSGDDGSGTSNGSGDGGSDGSGDGGSDSGSGQGSGGGGDVPDAAGVLPQ